MNIVTERKSRMMYTCSSWPPPLYHYHLHLPAISSGERFIKPFSTKSSDPPDEWINGALSLSFAFPREERAAKVNTGWLVGWKNHRRISINFWPRVFTKDCNERENEQRARFQSPLCCASLLPSQSKPSISGEWYFPFSVFGSKARATNRTAQQQNKLDSIIHLHHARHGAASSFTLTRTRNFARNFHVRPWCAVLPQPVCERGVWKTGVPVLHSSLEASHRCCAFRSEQFAGFFLSALSKRNSPEAKTKTHICERNWNVKS